MKNNRMFKAIAFTMAALVFVTAVPYKVNAEKNIQETAAQDDGIMEWQNYSQYIYNTTNGLMSNEVSSVVQSDDGVVWIGTGAGLVGFDGSEFMEYGPFFHFDGVNDIIKTRAGGIWCATTTYGAAVYLGNRFQHFDDVSESVSNYATAIVQGADGRIYEGSLRGMLIIDPDAGYTRTELIGEDYFFTTSLAAGSDMVCGITIDGDVFFLSGDEEAGRIEHAVVGQASVEYADGYFIVGMADGSIGLISENNIDGGILYKLEAPIEGTAGAGSAVNNFYYEKDARLWVLSDGGIGYYILDNGIEDLKNSRFIQCTFDDFESGFTDMMMDYQGNYWISSSKRGVLLLRTSEFVDELSQLEYDMDSINSVYEKDGLLYAATDSGIAIVDTEKNVCVESDMTRLYEGKKITDMAYWNGALYTAVYGEGVYDEKGSCVYESTRVNRLEVIDDNLYILTASGCIILYNDGNVSELSEKDGLYNTYITGALVGMFGRKTAERMYLASEGAGIYVFKDGELEEIIDENSGLPSKNVNGFAEYKNGFFIATDNGIAYYDGRKLTELKKLPEVLDGKKCENLFIKDDSLYVVCSDAVCVIGLSELFEKGENGSEAAYQFYDSQSGFFGTVTDGGQAFMDESGRVFIPCGRKIYSYVKSDEQVDISSLKVMLQSVKESGRQVEVVQKGDNEYEVSLAKDAKDIDIFCSVFNFSNADPQVRYIMHGVDKQYTVMRLSELQHILYEELEGGSHIFWFELLGDETDEAGNAVAVQRIVLTINKEKTMLEKLWVKMLLLGAGFSILMYFVFKDRKTDKPEGGNYEGSYSKDKEK